MGKHLIITYLNYASTLLLSNKSIYFISGHFLHWTMTKIYHSKQRNKKQEENSESKRKKKKQEEEGKKNWKHCENIVNVSMTPPFSGLDWLATISSQLFPYIPTIEVF